MTPQEWADEVAAAMDPLTEDEVSAAATLLASIAHEQQDVSDPAATAA